jgi:hypothetical protein
MAAYADVLEKGKRPEDYLQAIAHREIDWLSKYAIEAEFRPFQFIDPSQDDPQAHIALHKHFQQAAKYLLPKEPDLNRLKLWYWDLHAGNIFVTGNKITRLARRLGRPTISPSSQTTYARIPRQDYARPATRF